MRRTKTLHLCSGLLMMISLPQFLIQRFSKEVFGGFGGAIVLGSRGSGGANTTINGGHRGAIQFQFMPVKAPASSFSSSSSSSSLSFFCFFFAAVAVCFLAGSAFFGLTSSSSSSVSSSSSLSLPLPCFAIEYPFLIFSSSVLSKNFFAAASVP
jgi:hypothetical protein